MKINGNCKTGSVKEPAAPRFSVPSKALLHELQHAEADTLPPTPENGCQDEGVTEEGSFGKILPKKQHRETSTKPLLLKAHTVSDTVSPSQNTVSVSTA